MNKFLYKNIYCLYFITSAIRMMICICTGNEKRGRKIINEHNKWKDEKN
jgi:hypothetical protein